eukprot:7294601-Prorocentrum_lima.AAC.1
MVHSTDGKSGMEETVSVDDIADEQRAKVESIIAHARTKLTTNLRFLDGSLDGGALLAALLKTPAVLKEGKIMP